MHSSSFQADALGSSLLAFRACFSISCKSCGLLFLDIRSVAAVLLENINENRLHVDIEKHIFSSFQVGALGSSLLAFEAFFCV